MPFHYTVFGLSVESQLELPEMLPMPETSMADIHIRYGELPPQLDSAVDAGARWQTAPGVFHLNLLRLGRFRVCDGKEIIVQPLPGVSEDRLRAILLSSCLANLLHQRQLFALHCSAIRTEHGAVLFAGNSGMGKSTLVSAMLGRGYKMLADDMLALAIDEAGRVLALPGFPQVKLWADSAKELGRPTDGLQRLMPEYDRFIVYEADRFEAQAARLSAIYFLRTHNSREFVLDPLTPSARFNALLDNTWQKLTLPGLGLREWHFQIAAKIASLAYAARFTRPAEPLEIRRTIDLLEADMQSDHRLT